MNRMYCRWMGMITIAACLTACGGETQTNEKEGVETVLPSSVVP